MGTREINTNDCFYTPSKKFTIQVTNLKKRSLGSVENLLSTASTRQTEESEPFPTLYNPSTKSHFILQPIANAEISIDKTFRKRFFETPNSGQDGLLLSAKSSKTLRVVSPSQSIRKETPKNELPLLHKKAELAMISSQTQFKVTSASKMFLNEKRKENIMTYKHKITQMRRSSTLATNNIRFVCKSGDLKSCLKKSSGSDDRQNTDKSSVRSPKNQMALTQSDANNDDFETERSFNNNCTYEESIDKIPPIVVLDPNDTNQQENDTISIPNETSPINRLNFNKPNLADGFAEKNLADANSNMSETKQFSKSVLFTKKSSSSEIDQMNIRSVVSQGNTRKSQKTETDFEDLTPKKILNLLNFDPFSPQASNDENRIQNPKDANLATMRPAYKKFVQESFPVDVQNRLKTFEKFAFTRTERDDHKDIVPFLNDLKSPTQPTGSMNIVDLWSNKLQRDVLKKCSLYEEKQIVQKFGYYFHKNKKLTDFKSFHMKKDPLIFSKKEENIYKDLIHMRNAKKDFMKKQESNMKQLNLVKRDPLLNTQNIQSRRQDLGLLSERKFDNFLKMIDTLERENIKDFASLQTEKDKLSSTVRMDKESKHFNKLKKLIA